MNFIKICTLVDFISAMIIYIIILFPQWKKSRHELFVKSCLYIYIIGVLYFTCIIPIIIPVPGFNVNVSLDNINLIPFVDYLFSRGDFIVQILLNILMLVPFGIMYPYIYKKNLKSTLFIGFLACFCIEIMQLLSVRQIGSCDVTDVITNVIGVLVGYIIYSIFKKPIKIILNTILKENIIKTFIIKKHVKIFLISIIAIQLLIRSIMIIFI